MASSALIIAAAIMLATGAAAQAQNAAPAAEPQTEQPQISPPNTIEDVVKAMVGPWELSNADHDKLCRLNFRAESGARGRQLDVDKACASVFPSTKDMTAWTLDNYGNLTLLNSRGVAVLELTEVEGGMYDGFKPEEGRYILQAAAAAAVQFRTADDMVGEWAITRGSGNPICNLTLAGAPTPTDTLPLKLKPGCDALITRFGPATWRMDQGELLLVSPRGQTWRFEENDPDTWQRVPETPDPILLVRQ